MAWKEVCRPKKFEGLGLRDTRSFNDALLARKVLRVYSNDIDWYSILHSKYLHQTPYFKDILFSKGPGAPSFGIVSLNPKN